MSDITYGIWLECHDKAQETGSKTIDVALSRIEKSESELADLRARLEKVEKVEKDAARFNALLDMSTIEAQAVLWNCTNRKARLKVIDAAIAKERT